jgi:hypothetical protein
MSRDERPISITNASYAHSDEQPGRAKRYLISMLIRTACFIGAILTPSPIRWFLIVGAVTLPYIAVVMANAGQARTFDQMENLESKRELEF